jgi:hypothetical protein
MAFFEKEKWNPEVRNQESGVKSGSAEDTKILALHHLAMDLT